MDLWTNWTSAEWEIVVAVATVATAVATGAAILFSWFWRLVDRQRAAWITFDETSAWGGHQQFQPSARFELANVGSGAALAVRVHGIACKGTLQGESRETNWGPKRDDQGLVPVLRSGDQVHMRVYCEPDDWDRAEVVVAWKPTPSLRKRRKIERIKLNEIAVRPTFIGTTMEDGLVRAVADAPEPEPPVLNPENRAQFEVLDWWRLVARRKQSKALRRPR